MVSSDDNSPHILHYWDELVFAAAGFVQMEFEGWVSMQEELMECLKARCLEKSEDSCGVELQYSSSHSGPTPLVTFLYLGAMDG